MARDSSIDISIALDTSTVKTGLDRIKADFSAVARGISASLATIKDFERISQEAAQAEEAFAAIQQRVEMLSREVASGQGGRELARELAQAEAQARALEAAMIQQQAALQNARRSMDAAGLSTHNLAGQQATLEAQLEASRQSFQNLANMEAARRTLGVRSHSEITAEIDRQRQAYRLLATSGTLSAAELGQAQDALRARIEELSRGLEHNARASREVAAVDQARATIGVRSHREVAEEIARQRQAYQTLAASGRLSMTELAQANVAMRASIEELNRQTNGWRDALANAKGSVLELAAAFAPLGLSVAQAIKFESAWADVRKVVDGSDEELASMRKEILDLTDTLPMTAQELSAIAAAGGQLGVATNEIAAFTTVAAKMGVAFDMSAADAGDAIGKLRNLFNLSVADVERFGDAINQLGNNTAGREREIVNVMMRIGGSTETFGLAKEKAAALAATMLSLGKSPEVAATSINSMLGAMQTATMQSKDFQVALAKIGMNAKDMAAQVAADPQKALDDLLNTLEKLKGQERAEVLTGLFGKEFQDDIAVLVNGLPTYRKALDQVADSTKFAGAMNKEFAARSATTESQLKLLKNAVDKVAINLGTIFLPAIRAILEPISITVKAMAVMVETCPVLSAALATVGAGALVFGQIAKLAGIARLAMLTMARDSMVAIRAMNATTLGSIAALGSMSAMAGVVTKALGGIALAFAAGWEIGTLLNNKFDSVRKAGIAMAGGLERAILKVREAWAWLTGGDVEAVRAELLRAEQFYNEAFDNVGKKAEAAAKKQIAEQKKVTEGAKESAKEQKAAQEKVMAAEHARATLGIKSHSEITAEIEIRKRAFETLAASGKLNAIELGQAQAAYLAKVKELSKALEGTGVKSKEMLAAEQARATLGIKSNSEITAEIKKQKLAFETLAFSGSLSVAEVGRAQAAYLANTKELSKALEGMGVKSKEVLAAEEARSTLGVRSHSEITAEIEKQKKAFETLASSGSLSAAELGQAQAAYLANTKELSKALEGTGVKSKEMLAAEEARATLGVKSHSEITAEIKKQEEAFETLAASGKLSAAELARAEEAMKANVKELSKGIEGTGKESAKAIKEMADEYKAYVDKIKDLQANLVDREKSLTSELREMRRGQMENDEAWNDRKAEADEYYAAAQQAHKEAQAALEAGDEVTANLKFEDAKTLADQAKAAYKDLNTEVKVGDKVVISSAEALEEATKGMQASHEVAAEAILAQQKAAVAGMNELAEKATFSELTQSMSEAERQWLASWQKMSKEAVNEIGKVDKEVARAVKANKQVWLSVKITVDDESQKASSSSTPAMRLGGPLQALAAGGSVAHNIIPGGALSGFGGGDTRLLLGEPGEFMTNKWATKLAGLRAMHALNAGNLRQAIIELSKRSKERIRFQAGGLIGSLPKPPSSSGGTGMERQADRVVELRFPGGKLRGDEQSVERLLSQLEQAGLSA